jgi:hypothetical protein
MSDTAGGPVSAEQVAHWRDMDLMLDVLSAMLYRWRGRDPRYLMAYPDEDSCRYAAADLIGRARRGENWRQYLNTL